jgi:hypothetical protein
MAGRRTHGVIPEQLVRAIDVLAGKCQRFAPMLLTQTRIA